MTLANLQNILPLASVVAKVGDSINSIIVYYNTTGVFAI